jgi:hypothetical protein
LPRPGLVGEQERAVPVGGSRHHLRLVRHQLAAEAARSEVGAGSGMQEDAPPEAFSKRRSSGCSSSHGRQLPRAVGGRQRREKSGSRNGLASCREMTDAGHHLALGAR